ncbi:NAD(P)/FAD-dependent oxidoreductase [Aquabacterium lacunae]|uniref:NAD(P)/FAD-dependent oxidoreductase n=1 Tax=Aquabacterium lacunae TaxID=2528630 RepID=A0A4V2JFL6_9BURK|nr:NAD(P)/FAD-dependent oxidoreductase [Aquabacterium lacunae]TBO30400.1 NAD(P)/FAD-dependent oxidoreductase [Aquabacterium lacunae]
MPQADFDVVVVGASLAGCATAILLARGGARVALIERHARHDTHKQLCTHYIQASAWPVLERLGLVPLIETAGGVPNIMELHTPHGWIADHPEHHPPGQPLHGYNIRRARLDPMVRQLASDTRGVTLLTGVSARGLIDHQGRIAGVRVQGAIGERSLRTPLVVAADGRHSEMARLAGVVPRQSQNRRHGVMLAMRGVDLQRGQRSQMWLTGPEVAYVFPNDDSVTLLAWCAPPDRFDGLERPEVHDALLARIRSLPDAPQLHEADVAGDLMVVRDHPNLYRPPVVRGMALVGDALQSVDYVHGVGCGWALQGAEWLAEALSGRLKDERWRREGLKAYARQVRQHFGPHRFFIDDFARRLQLNAAEHLFCAAAVRDPRWAARMMAVGARHVSPWSLMRPGSLASALWLCATRQPLPEGTRQPLSAHELAQVAARSTPGRSPEASTMRLHGVVDDPSRTMAA